jgi:hypothetical protein
MRRQSSIPALNQSDWRTAQAFSAAKAGNFDPWRTARKTLVSTGKISMLQPIPLRWPRDAHVLFGPGPEHQENQL